MRGQILHFSREERLYDCTQVLAFQHVCWGFEVSCLSMREFVVSKRVRLCFAQRMGIHQRRPDEEIRSKGSCRVVVQVQGSVSPRLICHRLGLVTSV